MRQVTPAILPHYDVRNPFLFIIASQGIADMRYAFVGGLVQADKANFDSMRRRWDLARVLNALFCR